MKGKGERRRGKKERKREKIRRKSRKREEKKGGVGEGRDNVVEKIRIDIV